MKTLSNKTQTFFKISFLAIALIFGLASCSSDDDGDDNGGGDDVTIVTIPAAQVTTYTGTLNYSGTQGTITNPLDGTATISGTSSNYTISFSDGAPSVSGLTFESTNGTFVAVGGSNVVVVIDDENLTLTIQNGGDNWVFDGDR